MTWRNKKVKRRANLALGYADNPSSNFENGSEEEYRKAELTGDTNRSELDAVEKAISAVAAVRNSLPPQELEEGR